MTQSFKRICVLVLDGFGVGALPDASKFGDDQANTLKRIQNGLKAPHLRSLGLLELAGEKHSGFSGKAVFGKLREASAGKDTTTGHWEMMGLPLKKDFDFFPKGFPAGLMEKFLKVNQLGGFLGNKAASGTEIIVELGEEHLKTGFPIVYTSADSVFQIACHEEGFGLQRLYEVSERTRELLNQSEYTVGRVIARPFLGTPGSFVRTKNRKDYSIKPPGDTVLTRMKAAGLRVIGIGKIPSIFDHEGLTDEWKARDDDEGIAESLRALGEQNEPGLIFSNLNDLDTLYGHRRNVEGYRQQLEKIDEKLALLMKRMTADDLLLITSDHGNDPGFKGTDHTREYVPLLAWTPRFDQKPPAQTALGERMSFGDVGASILENFGLATLGTGQSFLSHIRK